LASSAAHVKGAPAELATVIADIRSFLAPILAAGGAFLGEW
jgi:hypothetical protein